ncbi:MAG: histone deacetylase family protein [Acidobacteria bacterium]|nr:histone deacetylase family protein [Acidobacteriota bacterium]
MNTIYSHLHHRHHGNAELIDGKLLPCFEMPRRAEMVLARVREVGLGDVAAPDAFGLDPIRRVHDDGFVDFLATAWAEWTAEGRTHDALPLVWPVRSLRGDRVPEYIDGKLGYYSLDAGVPITAGTWEAITTSADVALTGARVIADGAASAFALCRPPGHHAASAAMGGYCYLNNAAIAAQYLRDHGCARVAILDVDYHHGNGTQEIFYQRRDVLFLSLHADPRVEYPYFLGYADELGAGPGFGFTRNYPLPHGTTWDEYGPALADACDQVRAFRPETLVVSLGVDTYEHDPISKFRLRADDFPRIGAHIAALDLPTLFVMEGGYAVEDIGVNAVSVLTGFEQGR